MKKNYYDITILVDKSGSMSSLKNDVIGGLNDFIDDQRKIDGEAKLSLIQFDHRYDVNYIAKDINSVEDLDESSYRVGGMTALYDAIGKTIVDMGVRFSEMEESDRPEKVIFIIQTDGEENSSVEYKQEMIKEMINHQTNNYSWEFVFLGANIDAKTTAKSMGINIRNAMNFEPNSTGMYSGLRSVSSNLSDMRCNRKEDMSYTLKDYDDQLNAAKIDS